MSHLDLRPLYRSSIGFDRLANILNNALDVDTGTSYPPYNIEKTGDSEYRITLAVAGFSEDDLSIESRENKLIVTGSKSSGEDEDERQFLHRGIAERNFERKFQLADHVKVTDATIENGLLHIQLVHEVPEALKPRTITINNKKRQLEKA
jgi:molecular chaperone IbpA